MSATDTEFSSILDTDFTDSSDFPESTTVSLDNVVTSSKFQRSWLLVGGILLFLAIAICVLCFSAFVLTRSRSNDQTYLVDGYNINNERTFSLKLDSVPELGKHDNNNIYYDGENVFHIQKLNHDEKSDKFKCSAQCHFEDHDDSERRSAAVAPSMIKTAFLTITVFAATMLHAKVNSQKVLDDMCSEVTHVQSAFHEADFSHDFQVQGLDCEGVTDEKGRYMGGEYNSMHLCTGLCHKEGSDKDELICYEKVGSKTVPKALMDSAPLLDAMCATQLGLGYKARNVECKNAMSIYIAGKCKEL